MSAALGSVAALTALLGAGVGVGVLLIVLGAHSDAGTNEPGRGLLRSVRDRGRTRPGDRRRLLRLGVAVTVGVLVGVGTGWVVGAVLAGLACWTLPRILGGNSEHARRVARIEAIATWTEMLRDTIAAAAGLEQAILTTTPLAPTAIRGELTELATRIENGDRLAPALRRLADRLADPTGDLVIAALVLAADQHARQLGDLLGALAQAAREQAAMRMRIEAGRTRIRTSVRVIIGTTLAFAVAVVLFNRTYLSAYDTAIGQVVLLGIAALFCAGFTWLARIATVAEPARFLSLEHDHSSAVVPERQV